MKLSLFSAAFAAAMLCSTGSAQTTIASANIPFAFQVGDTTLPAGNYMVQDSQSLLRVFQPDGSNSVFHLTIYATRPHQTPDARMVFKRYGNTYYLTSVWNAGSTEGRSLVPGKRERALAKRYQTFAMADVRLLPKTP